MAADLQVLFADDWLLVINKPGGLLAVPGRGPDKQDCVVSRVRALFPDLPEQPAVHRLDMPTSGLMLLARNSAGHRHLSRQFADRLVVKRYIAIVEGTIDSPSGLIELSFRLDPDNRPYQVYDPVRGKRGVTKWRRIGLEADGTRIEFSPLTGRTHQLRLHAAHPEGLNAPIVGDALYGSGRPGDALLLHASQLVFQHPANGTECRFESAPPF